VTGKADFTEEEWKLVLEGPPSAGLIVAAAQRGGTFREAFAISKAYVDARKEHGESELLDEIVNAKPETDHTRYHSPEELKEASLKHITDAVELLKSKAAPEEVEEYKKFIVALANRVAEARKEGFMGLSGDRVSDDETAAIAEVEAALQ
jgi:hypothetical protein